MARADLSSLLGKIDTEDVVSPAPGIPDAPASPPVTDRKPAKQSARGSAQSQSGSATVTPKVESAIPPDERSRVSYLEFVRKETRLREDQYETLTEYARKLNRAKSVPGGERITENTLIRIAIDLLIPHLDQLRGDDETALRKSVSNGVSP
ncbi:hypothetical protein IT072_20945 (plasmid) [Leifsonia sp. ZF2019]|uniref:hypothetical protein n=1 Tax=Leifsonia sp. ZF2019 TaxID=2781978 RepID=UPI001CBFE953|nr:hypothetical protein [Leifsonia sp. ZF2019]UAJ81727.1 hypothetical protein IT072_20945 [Leifsonia sp. ZF2019]